MLYNKNSHIEMDKDYLIKKWLNDDLTEAEQKAFEALPDAGINQKILAGAKAFKASHFSKPGSYEDLKAQLKPHKTPVFSLQSYQLLVRIAAILIIGFSATLFYIYNQNVEIATSVSQKTNITLPDGSYVQLNSESVLKYNRFLWKFRRKLYLTGEAFFKVQKGSDFDVKTSKGTVTVVGTQFNVKCRQNIFEVQCYQGIVRVKTPQKTLLLTKGQAVSVIDRKVIQKPVLDQLPQWLNDSSYFKSAPLAQVFKALEKEYHIQVITQHINLQQTYTGGFVHHNLEQALKEITIPFHLTYSINPSKKIVIISSE